MNAVAACGLQLYRFGQAVSIVFFTESWRPHSFFDRIVENVKLGLHTLCLLDIKVKEPTLESLARGKPVYEPPRYMTIQQVCTAATALKSGSLKAPVDALLARMSVEGLWGLVKQQALQQILEVSEQHNALLTPKSLAIGIARLGAPDECIRAGSIEGFLELGDVRMTPASYFLDPVLGSLPELMEVDFGPPLHSLVLVGDLHPLEEQAMAHYLVAKPNQPIS